MTTDLDPTYGGDFLLIEDDPEGRFWFSTPFNIGRNYEAALIVKQPEDLEYHRNGVSGEGFYVVAFTSVTAYLGERQPDEDLVGIVFPESRHVAVFNRERIGQGDVRFGYNSYRGDNFEGALRAAIDARYDENGWTSERFHLTRDGI